MLGQVDQAGGFLGAPEGGFEHGFGLPREGDHRAVMVGVHLLIEKRNAGDPRDGRGDHFQHLGAPALAEIRNAFNKRHGASSL